MKLILISPSQLIRNKNLLILYYFQQFRVIDALHSNSRIATHSVKLLAHRVESNVELVEDDGGGAILSGLTHEYLLLPVGPVSESTRAHKVQRVSPGQS